MFQETWTEEGIIFFLNLSYSTWWIICPFPHSLKPLTPSLLTTDGRDFWNSARSGSICSLVPAVVVQRWQHLFYDFRILWGPDRGSDLSGNPYPWFTLVPVPCFLQRPRIALPRGCLLTHQLCRKLFLRTVYTYRHRRRVRVRHRQSLTPCQYKRTVWWAEWARNPPSPSNGPSLFTQCRIDGHGEGDGTCKQALRLNHGDRDRYP